MVNAWHMTEEGSNSLITFMRQKYNDQCEAER